MLSLSPRTLALQGMLTVLLLLSPLTAGGQVTVLDCADQISGTVIDFDQPADLVNEILSGFDMESVPNQIVTSLVPWVVGNPCAGFGDQAGFSDGFVISTTGDPWGKIGLSALGTLLAQDREITLNVYDIDGNLLGTTSGTFMPGNSMDDFNAGVLFLGFESTTPIHSFELLADNPNIAWDEIRFEPVCTVGCGTEFIRGDADADGNFSGLTDGFFVLAFQFIPGSPPPPCLDAADFDDDEDVNGLVDGVGILNFQ